MYDTEGSKEEGQGGNSEEKNRSGGEGPKGPAKEKTESKRRRRRKRGELQIFMLEHASRTIRIVKSGSVYLATEDYIKSTVQFTDCLPALPYTVT